MLRILLLIFLASGLLGQDRAHAVETDGLVFDVTHAGKGQWAKSRHRLANDWVQYASTRDQLLSYAEIKFRMRNNNENKKIDLAKGFDFVLKDEFGNVYRRIKKPSDYEQPVLLVSKNFPSVYPGETYGETLFFEEPLAKARQVELIIDARSIGIEQEISVPVPPITASVLEPDISARPENPEANHPAPPASRSVAPAANRASLDNPDEIAPLPAVSPNPAVLISAPANGATIMADRLLRIQVDVKQASAPDRISVSALNQNFTDYAPKLSNLYEFMVPADCPTGLSGITATASWLPAGKPASAVSTSIFVYATKSKP